VTQPNMLASCLVLSHMGVQASAVDILLNILLVCHQAMKESGYQWPLNRPGANTLVAIRSSRCSPTLSTKTNQWLADVAQRGAEAKSDKYLLLASINLVNCVAYAGAQIEPT
jgi:hypothetical protein